MRYMIAIIVAGLTLMYYGIREAQLSLSCGSTPQEITCRELATFGSSSNPYVIVTDFAFGENVAIKTSKSSDSWQQAWIPMHSVVGEDEDTSLLVVDDSQPDQFRVLVMTRSVAGEQDLAHWENVNRMEGIIVNGVIDMESDARAVLRRSYPDVDFTQVWILDHGHKPVSFAIVLAMVLVGLGLCGGGGYVLFKAWREWQQEQDAAAEELEQLRG